MPFLRVLRDKRGYETTYLMHWFREGSRQRSRILYVFRTPPGVRVGRDALDAQVIREIQAKYPDIEFDWRALRENQQVIETSAEARRPRAPARATRPEPPEVRGKGTEGAERPGTGGVRPRGGQTPPEPGLEPPPPPPRIVIPTTIEGTTREQQFVFLLRCYLDLRERVPHRTQDPIRRDALVALVERLNPEAWVGEEAVVAGLKNAREALERLSHIFAKRRKRPRRAKIRATPESTEPAVHDGAVEGEPAGTSSFDAETELRPIEALEPETREPEPAERELLGPEFHEPEPREPHELHEPEPHELHEPEPHELHEPEPSELPELPELPKRSGE